MPGTYFCSIAIETAQDLIKRNSFTMNRTFHEDMVKRISIEKNLKR